MIELILKNKKMLYSKVRKFKKNMKRCVCKNRKKKKIVC